MAITVGSLIEVTNVGVYEGQVGMNVWQYRVDGSAFLVNAAQIAEAWWNHVKTTLRNIPSSNYNTAFLEARLRELDNPLGDFGTYAIPLAEQSGTRAPSAPSQGLASFNAIGAKLTVGSRVTRPGQKRFVGLTEEDQNAGYLLPAPIAAVDAAMAVMTAPMILGAPAATITLIPVIVRKGPTGLPVADQEVLGWVTNQNVTSQVSRKRGRGI